MQVENSIEVFNCSICSFCETSLDRLACHIRQHIKPEPLSKDEWSTVTPRDHTDTNENKSATHREFGNIFNTDELTPKKSQPNDQPGDVLASTINQLSNTSHNTSSTSLESNPLSPRIEVINPRTLAPTESYSVGYDVNNQQQLQHQQAKTFASSKTSHGMPPPLIEKSPQLSTYNGEVYVTPQTPVQLPLPSMMVARNEAPVHIGRYVQIHPRDQQQFVEMKSKPSYSVPPQYTSKQFMHTDFVPIAPAKVNTYQEVKTMPMDIHSVEYRRNNPGGERINTIPVGMQNVSYVSPHQRGMAQIPINSDGRMRQNQQLEVHPGYQVRANGAPIEEYRFNTSSHHQQNHPMHSPPQVSQHHHHHQRPPPPISHQQVVKTSTMEMKQVAVSTSQIQSRVSGIQYADIIKHQQLQNIGVPNNGTIMLNPDILLAASGGSTSMEQLAGVLVIPLKKTCEIGIQTDPIAIVSPKKTVASTTCQSVSCSVQTDLRMRQISEEHPKSPVPIFDSIRSTEGLFECLVCGDEFASDHHLQQHVTENHTHVCENCFHASTSLADHSMHMNECGKYEAEMLCMDCNNSFTSIKKLNQHRIKIHSIRMPFRCGICNVPFESHDAVMSHMATHDNDVPDFKCRYCTKVFQCAEALSKHFVRHKEVDVEYQCRFCRKLFNSDELLKDHIGYEHVITELDEKDIQKSKDKTKNIKQLLSTSSSANSHMTYKNNKKCALCHHCDLAFKNKELLARHLDICSKNANVQVSPFICDVCKEFFPSDIHRRQHVKKDHRRATGYRCPKCSKIYRTWSRLKFHTKAQHLRKVCPDCDTIFTKEHILRKHQEDVHGKPQGQPGERVYTCSLCNTMLNTLTGLMNHRRDIHPELKAMKTADQSSSATMLSIIDDEPVNFDDDDGGDGSDELCVSPCPHCNEIFTSNNLLMNHVQNKHSTTTVSSVSPMKNKNFTCQRCNATFNDEKRMKNHLGLTHGERPFVCDVCNKKFQYSSQIIWHMKSHKATNIKSSSKSWKGTFSKSSKNSSHTLPNFICQFCGARFRQEKLLKNHKGSAHKIKLFSCEICSCKFGHSTELIWHLRTCRAKFKRQNPGIDLPTSEESPISEQEQESGFDEGDIVADTKIEESAQYLIPSTESDDPSSPVSHIQLNKEEGEELLKNDPEFDPIRGEYSCPLCRKTTRSITGMKTHYGRVHGVWSKESSHRQNGHKVTIWPCRNCDQEFKNFDEIQTHSTTVHGITVNKEDLDYETRQEFIPDQNADVCIFTCPLCGISFDNTKSIRVHAFKKHGILLSDIQLNEWRSDTNDVVQADKSNNSNDSIDTGEEIRYKCPRCKAKFRTVKALRVHSFKRHGFILSKADLNRCKHWISRSAIIEPLNSNAQKGRDLVEAPNPCDKCGRVFGNYRALFTHYRQAHRIMDDDTKNPFVPRKPSRTELSIQNFPSASGQSPAPESSPKISRASTSTISSKPTPKVADSVDCPKCSRVFTNHKSFVAHLYSAHRVSKDQYSIYWPDGIPILPRESSNCPTCNKECVDKRAMRIHMYKAHGKHYRDYAQDLEIEKNLRNKSMDYSPSQGYDESEEISVIEDSNSPPACYICSKPFKGRKALMTHEYKYHGIRWVGLKRVFPQEVRNKPKMESPVDSIDLNGGSATMVNGRRGSAMLNGSRVPKSEPGVESSTSPSSTGYVCPQCGVSYHNRRAMTTHLCRVHKYRKDDIQLYFGVQQTESMTFVGASFNNNTTNKTINGESNDIYNAEGNDENITYITPASNLEEKLDKNVLEMTAYDDTSDNLVIDEITTPKDNVTSQDDFKDETRTDRQETDVKTDIMSPLISDNNDNNLLNDVRHVPIVV